MTVAPVFRDFRQYHVCDICGRRDVWSEGWGWFGSWRDIDDGKPVLKWCSDQCGSMLAMKGHYEAAAAFADDPEDGTPK